MKKQPLYLALLLSIPCYSKSIQLDQERLNSFKHGIKLGCESCKAIEKKLEKNFPICALFNSINKNFEPIQNPDELSKQCPDSLSIAEKFMKEIEQTKEYQTALSQAKKINSVESWRIVYDIANRKAHELIEAESSLRFPSLRKSYTDLNLKLIEFAQANETIDINQNCPYMEALGLIAHTLLYKQKESLKS